MRLRQHEANALAVANWLAARPEVARVYYPALPSHPGHDLWRRDFRGANGLLSVAFAGLGEAQALAVADGLKLFDIGASWGGYESLVLPIDANRLAGPPDAQDDATPPPMLRLHIGLEQPEDLIADLGQAIASALAM